MIDITREKVDMLLKKLCETPDAAPCKEEMEQIILHLIGNPYWDAIHKSFIDTMRGDEHATKDGLGTMFLTVSIVAAYFKAYT